MMKNYIFLLASFCLLSCQSPGNNISSSSDCDSTLTQSYCEVDTNGMTILTRYNPPLGYTRVVADDWGNWLRNLKVKPASHICRFYDGTCRHAEPKGAVIDMELTNQDIQQCADAAMRLWGEYLWERKEYHAIHFNFVSGFHCDYDHWRCNGFKFKITGNKADWVQVMPNGNGQQNPYYDTDTTLKVDNSHEYFRKYMDTVFWYANSASLEKETEQVPFDSIRVGDLLCYGGFPGHVETIVDMAKNDKGECVIMLAQSFMPAQETEIILNGTGSPWFKIDKNMDILDTGYWIFEMNEFRRLNKSNNIYSQKYNNTTYKKNNRAIHWLFCE